MKALVYKSGMELLALRDVPIPQIEKDTDVLMRVKATGICGTDIHILGRHYQAKPGIILGHESSGIVERVGKQVTNVKPGDKVILDPTYHCSVCDYCQTDRLNYCAEKHHTETGVSSNGTFAEYHLVNSSFLHPLPDELSFQDGTLTEPLACVLNALDQTRAKYGMRALVVGSGPLGLMFGLSAKTMGCEVTMGDISDYRIEQARKLGVFEDVQDYKKNSIGQSNLSNKFDLVIDTSGNSLERILGVIDRGGDILVAGLNYNYEARIKPSFLTDNGIRIIGSIDANLTFAPAIKLLRQKPLFREIVTHSFPLAEFQKAFGILGLNTNTGERTDIHANKVVLTM